MHREDRFHMMSIVRVVRGLLLSLVAGLALESPAVAQEVARTTVVVRTGYTSYDLEDLRSIMTSGVRVYSQSGLPVRLQLDFPAHVLWAADVLLPYDGFALGMGGMYLNTKSGFGYRDEAGRLGVWMTMQAAAVQASVTTNIATRPEAGVHVGLRTGFLVGFVTLEERVSFTELPQFDQHASTSLHAVGVTGELFAGFSWRPFQGWLFGAEVGLRYAPDATLTKDEAELKESLNVTGPFLGMWVGMEL
jgi:hypothetical protein